MNSYTFSFDDDEDDLVVIGDTAVLAPEGGRVSEAGTLVAKVPRFSHVVVRVHSPSVSAERRAMAAEVAQEVMGCIRLVLDDPERRRKVEAFALEKALLDMRS